MSLLPPHEDFGVIGSWYTNVFRGCGDLWDSFFSEYLGRIAQLSKPRMA
jgi:hypothetical protein